jgi:hypothetical protein
VGAAFPATPTVTVVTVGTVIGVATLERSEGVVGDGLEPHRAARIAANTHSIRPPEFFEFAVTHINHHS